MIGCDICLDVQDVMAVLVCYNFVDHLTVVCTASCLGTYSFFYQVQRIFASIHFNRTLGISLHRCNEQNLVAELLFYFENSVVRCLESAVGLVV